MSNQTIDGVQLLPCPFCGCQATFLTDREDYRIAGNHSKACPFLDVDVVVDSRAAWNSRAEQPEPASSPLNYGSLDPVQRLSVCRGEQVVAVVLPERIKGQFHDDPIAEGQAFGWNTCLDELNRLNPSL